MINVSNKNGWVLYNLLTHIISVIGCEVHGYDPTIPELVEKYKNNRTLTNLFVHDLGIGYKNEDKLRTMNTLLEQNGHLQRDIFFLKVTKNYVLFVSHVQVISSTHNWFLSECGLMCIQRKYLRVSRNNVPRVRTMMQSQVLRKQASRTFQF